MDNEFDLDLDFLNQSEKDDFNKVDDADSSNEGVDTDDTQLTEEEKKIIVDNTTNDNDANAAKTATDTADTTDDNKDSQNNNINTYFEFLVEQGLLDVEDDYKFDGKEETLETLKATTFKNQRQDFMNEVWNSLKPDFQKVLRYGLEGGEDPRLILQASVNWLDDIDLTKETNQIKIIEANLKETTTFSKEKIDKLIQNLKASDELSGEAYDAHAELKEINVRKEQAVLAKAQTDKQNEELQNVQFAKQVQNAVLSTDLISKERKGKVAAFIVNPINKNGKVETDIKRVVNNILTNPNHIVQLADILYDYDFQKGIQTERFIKQGKTQQVQSLKERLDNKMGSAKAVSNSRNSANKSGEVNWDDFLQNW